MKRTSLVLAAIALTGLSACSTLDNTARADDTDWQKVALIEQYHRSHGSIVVWLNYPQKRTPVAGQPTGTTN